MGRGGSTRPRNYSGSPPGKKVDNRSSPSKDFLGIPISPNKFDMLGAGAEEEGEERDVVVEGVDKVKGNNLMKVLGVVES